MRARASPAKEDRDALLALVDATRRALHGDVPGLPAVRPDSRLEADLGFDSLGRMELLLRIERELGVSLPEDSLQRAETVEDLWNASRYAPAAAGARPPRVDAAAPTPALGPARAPVEDGATPADATTLLEVLDWHVARHPERLHATVLGDGVETPIRYRDLDAGARRVAAGLRRHGLQRGGTVAIMLPTSPAYFPVYLGILRAGGVPVPIYPPARPSQLEDHVRRHAGILANAGATVMVVPPEATWVARLLRARVPELRTLLSPADLGADLGADVADAAAAPADEPQAPVAVHGDDVAFIQYTSGSTGQPKGVALTHANLLANIRAMAQAVDATPDDVFVSWLPLYHDMGLIGAWLGSLYVGMPLVVMPPLAFLARPERWLQAMTRFRGTISAGPNFAYELCLKRIDDAALAGLELSSWRWAFNGAEAVGAATLERFAQRFAACGLRAQALAPVYGLAECAVGLLFPPPGRGPVIDRVRRDAFERERRALPAGPDDARALRFVGCGHPLSGHRVRIVDEEGREVGERVEGRLEFQGPSATRGYWRNPAQTARLFDGDWLDTGDRAYAAEGEVYVTGRVKDIVIRGGRNLHPQEIEDAVGAVEGVRKGCVAAFGSPDPQRGTERLVVLAEATAATLADPAAQRRLREAVGAAVVGAIGEPADAIVIAPPHAVLKTSSGKVRRSACRERFERGDLGAAPASARLQVARLVLGAVPARLRAFGAAAGRVAFGARAGILFALLAPVFWLLVVLEPTAASAYRVARRGARMLLRGAGVPLEVRGLEHVPAGGGAVLVCNHASYLDGLVLVAALPRPVVFVAKHELAAQFVAGRFLRALGGVFVERGDRLRAVEDARELGGVVRSGACLLVFPEGTFGEGPGVLPFHLGAYAAAVDAGAPVLAVALRGTREVLRHPSIWPRRAALAVEIAPALAPSGGVDGFSAAVRLRDATRAWIVRRLDATGGRGTDTLRTP
jgi:1-acyl-sn-glycerol-3-phosphate acyltransferase